MPVYSHSRLSSYENCPLQYKFRYIDRIRTDFESIEAFMGKKVHETLEAVYADLDRAREAGIEELITLFDRKWNDGLTPSVRVIRPDMAADDYREIGERCVRGFWDLNFPFRIDPEKIIGLEYRVDIALDKERRHRMMGYIDRLQHAEPGVIEIHDYKTSAKLPWKGSLSDDRQLPLYEMGIRQRFPETHTVRLIWHYLAHGETFTETRTREQLDRIRRSCIALIGTVERAREFPAKKGPLCAWCSYQEMCPEWRDEKPTASPAYPNGRPAEAGPATPPAKEAVATEGAGAGESPAGTSGDREEGHPTAPEPGSRATATAEPLEAQPDAQGEGSSGSSRVGAGESSEKPGAPPDPDGRAARPPKGESPGKGRGRRPAASGGEPLRAGSKPEQLSLF